MKNQHWLGSIECVSCFHVDCIFGLSEAAPMSSKHLPLLYNSTLIQGILGDYRLSWLQLNLPYARRLPKATALNIPDLLGVKDCVVVGADKNSGLGLIESWLLDG